MRLARSKKRPLLIVDDFHPLPELIRDYALESDFKPVEYEGYTYEGIGIKPIEVEGLLAEAMGFPVDVVMQFFRIGVAGDNLTVWIHADSICADLACVWYITPDELCRGGTGFWRHKETGWRALPPEGVDQESADRLNQEGQDKSFWELEEVAQMKWNRASIYPTSLFHSRWPKNATGNDKHDGRLIWCAFFNRRA